MQVFAAPPCHLLDEVFAYTYPARHKTTCGRIYQRGSSLKSAGVVSLPELVEPSGRSADSRAEGSSPHGKLA